MRFGKGGVWHLRMTGRSKHWLWRISKFRSWILAKELEYGDAGLALVLTPLGAVHKKGGAMVAVVVLDVLMVVTGLLAALSASSAAALVWFAWSCAAFVGVLYLLWGPILQVAVEASAEVRAVYRADLIFLTVAWSIYPLVFAAGPELFRLFSNAASVWNFLVLDVASKVVYGFFSAANVKRLPATEPAKIVSVV